ncbi:phospholipase A(1) DAD1, chloroplastic-like [Abrus precatorius]|uniref:Phospholipase A(1) DAD1, chloroplastic-like n=1 Tax=Abrus precatorius TaxID=3816 RepID=A0A8B8K110_ABRPR|nr:phospholipase A(1) DAD1, chloroplastic-like [Abrus precatorius]
MRLGIKTAAIQPLASSSISKPNPTLISSSESTVCSQFNNKSLFSWSRLKPNSAKCNFPKLGHKWKQYQGINNWEGLLDPLDDNLRLEILRYGHFVDAAYYSFDFDYSSLTYATCLYPKKSLLRRCGLANYGYRLTKNLRVTCGIHIPTWMNKMFKWTCTQSCWIGYVAICEHKNEITRLGRRDIVIAFRGTATCLEWLENLRATLTHLPNHVEEEEEEDSVSPMVQKGFLSLYTSKTTTHASLQEMVREEIGRVIQTYTNEPLSLTLTGHSLGAALAILSAYDITATFNDAPMVTVVSFGGPRVGNESFRKQLEQRGIKILRIVNSDDVVTRVPGFVVNLDDVASNSGVHVGILSRWLHTCVEDMQLVYADIGQELRLSSKESPYLSRGDVAMCHDLKTYLHLVKNFVSSSCPCTHKNSTPFSHEFESSSLLE